MPPKKPNGKLVPAVNNDGRFGRWAFVEVTDPWDAKKTIRAALGAAACTSAKTAVDGG